MRRISIVVAALGTVLAGWSNAAAQGAADSPDGSPLRFSPGLTLSVGQGFVVPLAGYVILPPEGSGHATTYPLHYRPFSTAPAFFGSVRLPLSQSTVVEAELSRTSGEGPPPTLHLLNYGPEYRQHVSTSTVSASESRTTSALGANLLFRVGTPRFSQYFGGGLGVRHTRGRLDAVVTCEGLRPGGCTGRPDVAVHDHRSTLGLGVQALAGLDVTVAPRLAVFVDLRWMGLGATSYVEAANGFGMTGGLRVVLRQGSPHLQLLREIRITTRDGERRANLIGSTNNALLVLENGHRRRVPLSEVRSVETVSHHIRTSALLGLVTGGLVGVVVAPHYSDEGRAVPLVLMGYGAGFGALVGAIIDGMLANRHPIDVAPPIMPRGR